MDERLQRAMRLCEQAIFHGSVGGLMPAGRDLDAIEADVALARARIAHARFLTGGGEDPQEPVLLDRAAEAYRRLGDVRGEAEAICWTGIYHQVVRQDHDTAVPLLRHAAELAVRAHDELTLSYALRHLGIADHAAGRLSQARERLEESTRLRREAGFDAGVAANLVGLVYIAAGEGRGVDALALIEQARAIATASSADTILHQLTDAERALFPDRRAAPTPA